MRNVKGILFADYVRMIRSHKGVDWTRFLLAEDLRYLHAKITPDAWYPMTSFERLGNAIFSQIAYGELSGVRAWGRASVDVLRASHPLLVAERDPVETLNRFRVLRNTFFDFEALTVPLLHEDEARIRISYHMGMPAEEAASHQTIGFFERLLEMSGAGRVTSAFLERSWAGDPSTMVEVQWLMEE
jgi:hypothetical protein